MNNVTNPPCPNVQRWRALLDDELAAEEQAELAGHLESCAACRSAFDAIAAGGPVWDGARDLAVGFETELHSGGESGVRGPSGLPFLEPTDEPGRMIGRFGPYEVEKVVGQGGMGVVLKAFDPSLHRAVAVKVLAPQLSAGVGARRRFVREARAAASVVHEHVVTIHAVDEWKGWPYLVMQYVGGKSLQERIDRSGPLEVKEILRIGMQTAQGLAAAHAQGLVHRDIKPANILLENGVERVKLTDFGLARAVDDPSLTQAGIVAGTPQYMSPEQARGEMVDARSDLFSLGSVMYAMATGRPPFRGDSTVGVIRKVCDETPRAIRESDCEFPAWLDGLIQKLLAKDPAFRFTSAAEVAEVLGDYLARLQRGESIFEDVPAGLSGLHDMSDVGPAKLGLAEDVGPEKGGASSRLPWRPMAAACVLGLLALGTTEAMGVTKVGDLVATVLRIKVPEGTLVLEIDDPETKVAIDGGDVVIQGGGVREVRLKAGSHQVETLRDGLPGRVELIEVRRGDKQTLRVGLEPEEQTVFLVPEVPGPGAPGDPGLRMMARQMKARAERDATRAKAEARSRSSIFREANRELDLAKELQTKGLIASSEMESKKLWALDALLASREAESRVKALRLGGDIADAIALLSDQARREGRGVDSARERLALGIKNLAELEFEEAKQRETLSIQRQDLIAEEVTAIREQSQAGLVPKQDLDRAQARLENARSAVEVEKEIVAQASRRLERAKRIQDRKESRFEELIDMLAEFEPPGGWPSPRPGSILVRRGGVFGPGPRDPRGQPSQRTSDHVFQKSISGPADQEGASRDGRPGLFDLEQVIEELDEELSEVRKEARTPENLLELRVIEETRREIQQQLDALRHRPAPLRGAGLEGMPSAPEPPEPPEPPIEHPNANGGFGDR